MKIGSLFSGGGLGDFGFMAAGMEIAWQCEIDEYCQKILGLRYPESKKYRDIKLLKGEELEKVDIITGGFPCQPFSVAGKRKGIRDDRNLWPEMFRIIKECRPSWVIGENVPGIINMELENICSQMESEGFEVIPTVFPAHALGALHKRDRLWIICHSKYNGQFASQDTRSIETGSGSSKTKQEQASQSSRPSKQYALVANTSNTGFKRMCKWKNSTIENVPNPRCTHGERHKPKLETKKKKRCFSELSIESGSQRFKRYWQSEPSVGRVANGIADRVHRLKMLGNGQVPACTYVIGKMIMDLNNELLQTQ